MHCLRIQVLNDRNNWITIIYKSYRKSKIKLFGKEFVDNNKEICKMIIKDEVKEICEYYDFKLSQSKKNILK